MKISATIITLNEEKNIAKTIQSLTFADEVIVVDSGSTDATVKIAESLGAKIVTNRFINYGNQKNFAATHATNEWIFNIDADEEADELLQSELRKIKKEMRHDFFIYAICRKTFFCNKWIKHGGWYPDIIGRLYNKNYAKWTEPFVHEKLILTHNNSQRMWQISGHINHYSFPTIESQILTNLKYSKLGAKDLSVRKQKKSKEVTLCEVIFRPIGKFFECYLIKKGFLDGKEGFVIAINAAHSMFLKYSFVYLKLL